MNSPIKISISTTIVKDKYIAFLNEKKNYLYFEYMKINLNNSL